MDGLYVLQEMKSKPIIAFLVTILIGVVIGVIGCRFMTTMKSYASVPQHANQGRAILERIDDYKKTHGDFPNQQWFDSLGDLSVTSEGHHWFYFNPPRNVGIRGGLLICTATDYGNQYLGGFVDGAVVMTRLKIQEEEQE